MRRLLTVCLLTMAFAPLLGLAVPQEAIAPPGALDPPRAWHEDDTPPCCWEDTAPGDWVPLPLKRFCDCEHTRHCACGAACDCWTCKPHTTCNCNYTGKCDCTWPGCTCSPGCAAWRSATPAPAFVPAAPMLPAEGRFMPSVQGRGGRPCGSC